MRIYVIIHTTGIVLIAFGVLLLFPALVALIYQEWIGLEAFLLSALIGVTSGFMLSKIKPGNEEINRSEGLIIVAMAWASAALLGAIPYLFFNINIINALFESMSGITTTGSTILTDFSLYPKSMFFWRSFSQWLGGMGIIVLFIAVLPQFKVAGRQLFFAEAPGPSEDKLSQRVRSTAIKLWKIYIILTIIEIILLTEFDMPLFDAICNSLSTLAAGGFSPHPESIGGYQNPIFEWIIIVFMFLAGVNFALQFRVIKARNIKLLFKNSEFLFYSTIFLAATVLLTLVLMNDCHYNIFDSLRIAAFQCISILTTTGFATYDFAVWPAAAIIILLILTFFGGCAGSSSGGIKIVRILLLIKTVLKENILIKHPNAVIPVKLDDQVVSKEIIRQIIIFILLYLIILIISTFIISFIESDITVGFSSSFAALGNIGPGLGSVGPMGNFADLHTISKLIMIFNMWAGRLEIIAVLFLLIPYTWKNVTRT
jgi:trk system potassium uptake protein TrkH